MLAGLSPPVLGHPFIVLLSSPSLWRGLSSGDSPEDPPSNLPALEGALKAWEGEGSLLTYFLCVLCLVVYSGLNGERRAYQDGGEDWGLYDPPQ